MKRYATLTLDKKVSNVIVAGSLEDAESVTASICILVTDITGEPHIGLSYTDGTFEQPPVEEAPVEETPA